MQRVAVVVLNRLAVGCVMSPERISISNSLPIQKPDTAAASSESEWEPIIYRFTFRREGPAIWIAHLDVMRTFERSLRRADLPLDWSGGFNPRPKIVFALPLGVGIEAWAELVDVTLLERPDPNGCADERIAISRMIERLNASLPRGFSVTDGERFVERSKSLMSLVERAVYRFVGPSVGRPPFFCKVRANYCSQIHEKRWRDINIRNLLLRAERLRTTSYRSKLWQGVRRI